MPSSAEGRGQLPRRCLDEVVDAEVGRAGTDADHLPRRARVETVASQLGAIRESTMAGVATPLVSVEFDAHPVEFCGPPAVPILPAMVGVGGPPSPPRREDPHVST